MVASAPMGVRVSVRVRIEAVGSGMGGTGLGGLNADDPSYFGSPGATSIAQTTYIQDAAAVPGTPGSYTLANLNTALSAVVTDMAGAATVNPLITSAILAQVNGWNTGNP